MSILSIKDLKWSINGNHILNNINMDFTQGLIHAVVGPNGVGKTTLGNVIMGIEGYRDFEGDLIYEGKSIKKMDLYQRAKVGITMAWQEPARFEGLTVEKFISAGAKDKSRRALEAFLTIVGMNPAEYMDRIVDKNLSGGERKKVELASILSIEPKLVILDEPDSGIDVASLQNIFNAMKYLKKNGATIILITHSLEVLKQSEHAFLLCCGSVLKEGTVDEISLYFENKCLPCDHINQPQKNGDSL
jgi:Fe-S cluster assembly ATP-binding protein